MSEPTQTERTESPASGRQPLPAGERRPGLATVTRRRGSELALLVCFLALIAAVPVAQTCLELAKGERVQFTDVFRYRPTAQNLRQYEETLKEKSWFQRKLRPQVQWRLFRLLRDTGSKAVLGRDHWLFYRPDVRYLVDPDHPEAGHSSSKWVLPADETTHRESVARAIVRFRDQLKERGITLLVIPVPGKPSVYPDQLTARAAGLQPSFESPTIELLQVLQQQDVPTVDLFTLFRNARRTMSEAGTKSPLYLAQDTHWTPLGAQLAAQAAAARLGELGLAPRPAKEYRTERVTLRRWGDVLDTMQIPGLRQVFAPEKADCERVLDPMLGPLLPSASDRPGTYRAPGQKATVLVLGDSFSRIYQYPEPQSLGELETNTSAPERQREPGTKRLLPGSAGFVSHLALVLKAPVDAIYSDGGASTDVRRKLGTNPEILEGKKVVIWEFVERDIALGRQGWEEVPLPPKLD